MQEIIATVKSRAAQKISRASTANVLTLKSWNPDPRSAILSGHDTAKICNFIDHSTTSISYF